MIQFAAGGRLVVATIQLFIGSNRVMQVVWDLEAGKPLDLPEPARAFYGEPEDPFLVTTPAARRGKSASRTCATPARWPWSASRSR